MPIRTGLRRFALAYRDRSYQDTVRERSMDVFAHLSAPRAPMREVHRALRRGAYGLAPDAPAEDVEVVSSHRHLVTAEGEPHGAG